MEAAKLTFKWLDGRAAQSTLAQTVYTHFQQDPQRFLLWAHAANATAFAALAPVVVQQSQQGDAEACAILQRGAAAIDAIGATLLRKQQKEHAPLPCSLVGGVTAYIEPYLSTALRTRLRPCQATPDAGAVMLVRQHVKEKA